MNPTAPSAPSPPWQMQKERLVKDDGRCLVYYHFVPLKPDAAQAAPPSSHGTTPKQESQ